MARTKTHWTSYNSSMSIWSRFKKYIYEIKHRVRVKEVIPFLDRIGYYTWWPKLRHLVFNYLFAVLVISFIAITVFGKDFTHNSVLLASGLALLYYVIRSDLSELGDYLIKLRKGK